MKRVYNLISKDMDAVFFIALLVYMFTEAGNLTLKDIDYDNSESFFSLRNMTVYSSYFFLALAEFGLGVKMSDSLLIFSETKKGIRKLVLFTTLSFLVTQGIVILNISNSSVQKQESLKEKTIELYGNKSVYSHPDSVFSVRYEPKSFKQAANDLLTLNFSGNDVRSFILIESSLLLTLFLTLFRNGNEFYKKKSSVPPNPKKVDPKGSSVDNTSPVVKTSEQMKLEFVNQKMKEMGDNRKFTDLPNKQKAIITKVWNKSGASEASRKATIQSILNAHLGHQS